MSRAEAENGKSPQKIINRQKLLEYLGNPENEIITRCELSTKVLGYQQDNTIYQFFTPDELYEIMDEALVLRRKRYAAYLSAVDTGQLRAAAKGDAASAKLVYQRFENWKEGHAVEHTGAGGGPIDVAWTVFPSGPMTIAEWEEQMKRVEAAQKAVITAVPTKIDSAESVTLDDPDEADI